MNIFWFHNDPVTNARHHCNKHVVKMPLELAQMLSTAHHTHASPQADNVYRAAYKHHPCTQWVSASADNYDITLVLFKELLKEYTYRYLKQHKSGLLLPSLEVNPCTTTGLTKIPLAMPDHYKQPDHIQSYRDYFIGEKFHIADWKYRDVPEWFTGG